MPATLTVPVAPSATPCTTTAIRHQVHSGSR